MNMESFTLPTCGLFSAEELGFLSPEALSHAILSPAPGKLEPLGFPAFDDSVISPLGITTPSESSALSSPFDATNISPFEQDLGLYDTPATGLLTDHDIEGDMYPSLFGNHVSMEANEPWAPTDVSLVDFIDPLAVPSIAAECETKPLKPKKASRVKKEKDDEGGFQKDKFNGTRNTKIPAIPFDAPTLPKKYLIPASTSRKRAPPAITSKLMPAAKKGKVSVADVSPEGADPSDLPAEIIEAIEDKRRSNTLAARRSRMRKAQYLDDLKDHIRLLEQMVQEKGMECPDRSALFTD